MFDLPVEHTILMPDYTTFELKTMISAIFPQSEETKQESPVMVGDHDIELVDREDHDSRGSSQFSHGWPSGPEGRGWEPHGSPWTGVRRGRGRPPLSGARLPTRFQCDYCNKGFYYRSMLTAHEKLHTGGKRETCEVCGAEYSTRQNLKNHMIKYHGADSFTPRKRGRPPVVREGTMRGRGIPKPGHLVLEGQDQVAMIGHQEVGMIGHQGAFIGHQEPMDRNPMNNLKEKMENFGNRVAMENMNHKESTNNSLAIHAHEDMVRTGPGPWGSQEHEVNGNEEVKEEESEDSPELRIDENNGMSGGSEGEVEAAKDGGEKEREPDGYQVLHRAMGEVQHHAY